LAGLQDFHPEGEGFDRRNNLLPTPGLNTHVARHYLQARATTLCFPPAHASSGTYRPGRRRGRYHPVAVHDNHLGRRGAASRYDRPVGAKSYESPRQVHFGAHPGLEFCRSRATAATGCIWHFWVHGERKNRMPAQPKRCSAPRRRAGTSRTGLICTQSGGGRTQSGEKVPKSERAHQRAAGVGPRHG
jgi:hypothetical protein